MNFSQIESPLYIIAVIANLTLAIIVLRYAPRTTSRHLFAIFVLAQVFWFTVNFFAFWFQAQPDRYLVLARWTMFFAAMHVCSFLLFVRSFLETRNVLQKRFIVPLLASLALVAALTLTPLVFPRLTIDGEIAPQPGPAMPIFGAFVGACVIGGVVSIWRKYRKAEGIERAQWRFLTIGLLLTFLLVLVFSFLGFLISKDVSSVRLGHVYTLPFVLFTAYAMIRHHLLDIKAIVAELAVVLLALIVFMQLLGAESTNQYIIGSVVMVGVVIVGLLLVRGVRKEVEQREKLQKLTEELRLVNERLEAANARLKELDKAKTEFLSITSHQLRTPLTGIKGYLSMMLEGDFGKFVDGQTEVLQRVSAEVDRLARMVQVFLNVSRIESGRLIIGKVEFDLLEMAQTVVKELTPLAEKKGLKLSYAGPHELKAVADPDKLKDVVMNLVDNAIKYTESGTIHVKVETHGNELQISVIDTGVGIDPAEAGKLFEKFSRGIGIAKVSAEGSGLGLFIVKKIVEAHGGRVWVESPGKGKGSAFAFVIPILPPEAQGESQTEKVGA